ncbi:MAG: AfsR/SARP family transcriptional regulator [Aggregatilineales bacterium]
MLDTVHQKAVEQLKSLDEASRLVILHPNYIRQRLLLGELLRTPLAYVRFQGRELSLETLRSQLEAALLLQTGNSDIAPGAQILLDECDRATPEALDALLLEAVDAVGPGRLYVMLRRPPLCVFNNDALRRKTQFVPADDNLLLWDYARRNHSKSMLLEVYALGTGRVLRDGQPVDTWDGLLPRQLFFFLVDRGMTTRSDIFETFWPNLSVREATNVFHVTKRKISEVLGVDLTVYWSGFYHISEAIELSYDVVQFSELVQSSVIAPTDEAIKLLENAVHLYRNQFLVSLDMPWIERRRQELHQTYSEALISLAKILEKRDQKHEALGLYLQAAATNRHREDVAMNLMLLFRELGMNGDALKVYDLLCAELNRSLGVAPAPRLQVLAQQIAQEFQAAR